MTGSRDITADTASAAAADTIQPVLFAKLEFDGGDALVHTGLGDLSFGGDTYTGIGKFGGISAAEEVSDLSNAPISLTMSGIPNDMVSILLNEQYQGRRATIYLGYIAVQAYTAEDGITVYTDESGAEAYTTEDGQLVDTPTILYRGLIDKPSLTPGKTFAITLTVGSRFAAWQTPLVRRYNNSDQQQRYPGDKGLQFIEQTANKSIWWGQQTP